MSPFREFVPGSWREAVDAPLLDRILVAERDGEPAVVGPLDGDHLLPGAGQVQAGPVAGEQVDLG